MASSSEHGRSQIWMRLNDEAQRLRRKQDTRIVAIQQRSAFLMAGFLAIAAIVGNVISAPLAEAAGLDINVTAISLLLVVLLNGIVWYALQVLPTQWHEAPDVDLLVRQFSNRYHGDRALQKHLVETMVDHYRRNERLVRRANRWVGFQAASNFSAVFILLLMLGSRA